jgi:hypothetical protein
VTPPFVSSCTHPIDTINLVRVLWAAITLATVLAGLFMLVRTSPQYFPTSGSRWERSWLPRELRAYVRCVGQQMFREEDEVADVVGGMKRILVPGNVERARIMLPLATVDKTLLAVIPQQHSDALDGACVMSLLDLDQHCRH